MHSILRNTPLLCLVAALASSAGCSKDPAADEGSSSSADGSGSDADADATTATTSDASGTSAETGDEAGFVDVDAMATCGESCNIYADNDCGEGKKCTAVVCEVGSAQWDSNICVEIMGSKSIGDDCSYLGTALDGLDDCGDGTMCWNEDPTTGSGVCVAFCDGSPDAPVCGNATTCATYNDGILPLCLPGCDPLVQDCEGNNLCTINPDGGFTCVLDASGGMGPYGTECGAANACNPGLVCGAGSWVPTPQCESAAYCCTPFCDVEAANDCPGATDGQSCQALFDETNAPPGFENVGVCAVPA